MAYVEVYFAQWYDHGDTLHEIKLLQEGGSGTTEITVLQNPIYTHQVRGGKTAPIKNQIYGSEITFNFRVAVADIVEYDAIFESDYKEWKIEHYYNSVLDWVGWLQPNNFKRKYVQDGNYYAFSLSAVDGLGNLKDVEFVNESDGSQYDDRVSLITIIKRALEHVGHELDFRVQLATWCTNDTLMVSTECALDKATADCRRFVEAKDGRLINTNCYKVISEILKPFSAHLIQSQGKYWIINPRDGTISGEYFPIDWATLTVSAAVGSDLRVSIISDEVYRDKGELQRIKPIETVGVTFRDRNLGDSLLSDGDFSSGTTSEWNNRAGQAWGVFQAVSFEDGYELDCTNRAAVDGVPTTPLSFYSDAQAIVPRAEDDQIKVIFSIRCASMTMDGAWAGSSYLEKLSVTCQIRQTTSSGTILPATTSNIITIGAINSGYAIYEYAFNVTDADDYFIEFVADKVAPLWSDYDIMTLRFDDISIITKYSTGDDITFDRYFKINNTDSVFIGTEEIELNFGDSQSDSDIAAFMISGIRTQTWARVLISENTSLNVLVGQNIIENYSKYKDYIRLNIFDDTDKILPHIIISLGSPNYEIVSQTSVFKRHAQKEIKVELVEFLKDTVTTSVQELGLNTVDSDPTPGSVFITNPIPTNPPGVTDYNQLTNLPGLQEITDKGATTDNDIIISGDIDGVRMIKVQNESVGVSASPMLFFKGDTSTSTIFVPSSAYSVASLRNKTIFYNSNEGFIWRTTGTDTMELSSLGVLNAAVNLQENGINISAIYEAVFSKNSGFNKNLGISSGTVSEGDHNHTVGLVILNAGVLTLNTSPQQILNAAGSNNLWVPEKVTLQHVFASAAFATNTTLQIGIGTSSGSAVYVDLASSVLTSVADQIDIETIPDYTNVVSNSRVYIKVKTGDPTAGGGSLRIQIIYKKLTSV